MMTGTISEVFARIEQQVKDDMAKEEIICPACGYTWEGEELYGYVSYYGEGDEGEGECSNCEAKVTINETVTRRFDVTLVEEDT